MKSLRYISVSLLVIFFALGCTRKKSQDQQHQENIKNAMSSTNAREMTTDYTKAVAVIHPTEGNNAMGTVTFVQTDNGINVHAEIKGLSPGLHGYHVHLYGDCTARDGTSAGTHFNFEGSSLNPPANIDHITGDLGNLNANNSGAATADTSIAIASLNGPKSIIGRAVVIHEKANDPSQPPIGAAGSRLGCGVIGIANTGTE